jgi:hypothetical protein
MPLHGRRVSVNLHRALVQHRLALMDLRCLGRLRTRGLRVSAAGAFAGVRLTLLGRLTALAPALCRVVKGRAVAHVLSVALRAFARARLQRLMGRRLTVGAPSPRFG